MQGKSTFSRTWIYFTSGCWWSSSPHPVASASRLSWFEFDSVCGMYKCSTHSLCVDIWLYTVHSKSATAGDAPSFRSLRTPHLVDCEYFGAPRIRVVRDQAQKRNGLNINISGQVDFLMDCCSPPCGYRVLGRGISLIRIIAPLGP